MKTFSIKSSFFIAIFFAILHGEKNISGLYNTAREYKMGHLKQ